MQIGHDYKRGCITVIVCYNWLVNQGYGIFIYGRETLLVAGYSYCNIVQVSTWWGLEEMGEYCTLSIKYRRLHENLTWIPRHKNILIYCNIVQVSTCCGGIWKGWRNIVPFQ